MIYPGKEYRQFKTPDGFIGTWWNGGNLVSAHLFPDFDPENLKRIAATGEAAPYVLSLCNWRQLETVDGKALWRAISHAARVLANGRDVDDGLTIYEYIERTEIGAFVGDGGKTDSFPTDSGETYEVQFERAYPVSERTIQNRIRDKEPITVLIALAYLKTPLAELRGKNGSPLEFDSAPSSEESNEAAKMTIADCLDRLLDEGCGDAADTVVSFLFTVEAAISLYQNSAVAKDTAQTILDMANASITAWRKMLYRVEAERAKAEGVTVLPPSDLDCAYEAADGMIYPRPQQ